MTYYVRKSGNDSNDGLSKATAFLTIEKARSVATTPGDKVYIGAGVYLEYVTNSVSGSLAGGNIEFIGDVAGKQTGDGGIVLISSVDDLGNTNVTRGHCWNLNGQQFITIRGIAMFATDTCLRDSQAAGNRSYDGVIVEDCPMLGQSYSLDLDLNAGATPTSAGLLIKNCKLSACCIRHENNGIAHVNVDMLFLNCEFHGYLSRSTVETVNISMDYFHDAMSLLTAVTATPGLYIKGESDDTYSIGGITVANCTVFAGGNRAIHLSRIKNTSHKTVVVNCKGTSTQYLVSAELSTKAAIEVYNNVGLNGAGFYGVTERGQFNSNAITEIQAGFFDTPLHRYLGYSPHLPGSPLWLDGFMSGTLGYGQSLLYQPTDDLYGRPRGMGRGYWFKGYFDGSDDSMSDPDNAWVNESYAVDDDTSTAATIGTTGSSSSGYIKSGGTDAPGSGGTIRAVYVRVLGSSSGSRTAGYAIYTDGEAETLLNATYTFANNTAYRAPWVQLSIPADGWTWAAIQSLQFRLWMTSGGSGTLSIYGIQIAVATSDGHTDVGAVEGSRGIQRDSSIVRNGTYSGRFDYQDFHEFWITVDAGVQKLVEVYAYRDANYTGTLPTLEVLDIPGVDDITVTMTVGAGSWERLVCNFTPTETGIARVRFASSDNSQSGKCYFDDYDAY